MTGSLRVVGGGAVLVAVVVVAGADAVPTALRSLDGAVLLAAAAVGAVGTVCAAWRWRLVAGRLGLPLAIPAALSGCYRAQFLNLTLPGGVLGDVGRAVGHGRAVDDRGRALRAVVWERSCGQAVLVVATVVAVGATGWSWPGRPAVPWWALGAAVVALGAVALAATWPAGGVVPRLARALATDARALAAPGTAVRVAAASVLVLGGHVVTFWLAARAVGVSLDPPRLVTVALVVLLAAGLPVNLAGWGPREGAAAWAFATAGSDASSGLAVAVAYGAIVLVASLPGAVLLLVRTAGAPWRPRVPAPVRREGAVGG